MEFVILTKANQRKDHFHKQYCVDKRKRDDPCYNLMHHLLQEAPDPETGARLLGKTVCREDAG
ncbi:MAG: hypothetical protein NT121_19730 [Chloroflexi bacterium]|nr:hypothetical protein [Chloroflexota bacterium]